MSECKYKAKDGECLYEKRFPYKEYCVEGPCPHDTPQTNADRIRAMTDEELAQWLCDVAGWLPTFEGRAHPVLEWLKQEGNYEYKFRKWAISLWSVRFYVPCFEGFGRYSVTSIYLFCDTVRSYYFGDLEPIK